MKSPRGHMPAKRAARLLLEFACAVAGLGALANAAGATPVPSAAPIAGAAVRLAGSVLARPPVPSPVSAADGVVAWAASSGGGHRFEVVVGHAGRQRRLRRTSAIGRIDALKLGTDARGRAIVVYSHCPKEIPDSNIEGAGCRLWWAPLSGARAHLVRAAPRGTSLGAAIDGTVTFVRPGSNPHLARASLTGAAAKMLPAPAHLVEGSISDISATSGGVAFLEQSMEPGSATGGLSQIWLSEGSAVPRLITEVTGDTQEIDDAYEFFVGLTLSGEFIYTFLYAAPGLSDYVPSGGTPVVSGLKRITLSPPATTTAAAEDLSFAGARIGLEGLAYDPTDQTLVASLIPANTYYPGTAMPGRCATNRSSPDACPVKSFGPVTFPQAAG